MITFTTCFVMLLTFAAASMLSAQEATSANSDAVKLGWKFKQGDQYSLSFDQFSSTESEVLDREIAIEVRVKMHVTWKVASVSEAGTATIHQSIDWMTMETSNTNPEGDIRTVTIDSRTEPAEELPKKSREIVEAIRKDVKPIIGATAIFKLSPRGKMHEFELPQATQEVLRDAPSSMQIRKIFSAQGMDRIFGPSAVEWPEKAIDPGGTWKTTRKLANRMGKFDQTFTYQLQQKTAPAKGDGTVTISVESETRRTEPGDEKIEIQSQSGSGKLVFNPEHGYLVSSYFETNVKTKKSIRPDVEIVATTRDEVMIEITKE